MKHEEEIKWCIDRLNESNLHVEKMSDGRVSFDGMQRYIQML